MFTLCTPNVSKASGLNTTGRVATLEKLFYLNDLDMIGIQEARLPGSCIMPPSEYYRYSSSATTNGTQGVQLWVGTRLNTNY